MSLTMSTFPESASILVVSRLSIPPSSLLIASNWMPFRLSISSIRVLTESILILIDFNSPSILLRRGSKILSTMPAASLTLVAIWTRHYSDADIKEYSGRRVNRRATNLDASHLLGCCSLVFDDDHCQDATNPIQAPNVAA